ncbi:restriction endonuclease subunit S [Providencia sp. JUb39]|uniref:restriction endonuclease subunit S n=1 Tax=Providencia sp. JUb39 TaxID=2724165 RepID=UPI00164E282E|nr:restriction endonuclease subunit S [Providencia sp. JUb39]MBC5792013.1 restriction endonuclease subunit S [Providencia sp. JUb39]
MIQNTPKLRFNEYSDNWIECPLSDLANLARGKFSVRPRNDPRYFGGNIPFIQTSDIVKSSIYVEQYSQTLNELGLKVSKVFPVGTIMITIAANIGDVAILKYQMACPDSLVGIEAKEFVANNIWLMYSLLLKKDELESLATQNAQKNINLQILNSLNIFIPAYQEQKKMAQFLLSVDKKIMLQSRKIELLQQYKKGMIQKLFSQKIRFKDDKGNNFPKWNKSYIGNILTIGSGRDYKHLNTGNIPVFGTGGLMTMVDNFLHDGETVCIGRKGTIDKPFYNKGKIWTVDTLFYTHSFKEALPMFVYQLFLTINWKEYNEASGVPSLSKKTIEKIEILLPCENEQQKIADFLSSIDDKITIENNNLEKLKQWKQGLLQKMFV